MAVALSNDLKIWVGGTPVAFACLTQTSFEATRDMRDTSCFDSNQYAAVLPSKASAKLSGAGLWDFAAGATSNGLLGHTNLKAGTEVDWEFGTSETGEPRFSGTGYFTSWKAEASGNFENVTYSFEIMVTGEWTQDLYT